MASFAYTGIQAGKKINGDISAADPRAATLELRKKKIIVTSIKKGNGKSNGKQAPSLDDIPLSNAPIIISKGNIYLKYSVRFYYFFHSTILTHKIRLTA